MTPLEAFYHMENILGQFNAIVAQQFTSLLMEKKVTDKYNYKANYKEIFCLEYMTHILRAF